MSSLGNSLRKLQQDDPDFGKVRNAPGDGFAVDCDVYLRDVLDRGLEQAATNIRGLDDYEKPVCVVPLNWTARSVFVELFDCGIPLPIEPDSLPLGRILHHLAMNLREICETPLARKLELEIPAGCFDHLKTERLVWLPGAGSEQWNLLLNRDILDEFDLLPRQIGGHKDE